MTDDPGHHVDGARSAATGPDDTRWAAFVSQVVTVADDPELIALTRTAVEAGPPPDVAADVYAGLSDALARSASPAVAGECLTLLLSSRTALQYVGERLNDLCLARARTPAPDADLRAWLLAADALEAATRLALGEWVPHFALLAELVKLPASSPPLFARAALRCLAASYERWREPALVTAIERIAGIVGPGSPPQVEADTAERWAHDVAADAAFELGCTSLLEALRAETGAEVEAHLQAAERRLASAADDRDDAAVMADVVRLLTVHLPTETGQAARADTDLSALAARLERGVREHLIGYLQLEHWRAPRLDAEVAWARLADEVARTASALNQVSWYDAEVVLADVLSAYTASRCSRVLRRDDRVGVRASSGPRSNPGSPPRRV